MVGFRAERVRMVIMPVIFLCMYAYVRTLAHAYVGFAAVWQQELLREQQDQEKRLAEAAGVTEADKARRAEHLKRQRELILAKKKVRHHVRTPYEDQALPPSPPSLL